MLVGPFIEFDSSKPIEDVTRASAILEFIYNIYPLVYEDEHKTFYENSPTGVLYGLWYRYGESPSDEDAHTDLKEFFRREADEKSTAQ